MTESTSGRSATADRPAGERTTAATDTPAAAPAKKTTATSRTAAKRTPVPAATDHAAASSREESPPERRREPLTFTIRLPFLVATLQRGPAFPAAATAPAAAAGVPTARDPVGTMEKLAFYGGVAGAGAAGVLEWPVAVAVAAGTWVAQHTPPAVRGFTSRPAPRALPAAPSEP